MTKEQFIDKADLIRGQIIGHVSEAELTINCIIANYFSPDKSKINDMISLVTSIKDFAYKISVLGIVITKQKKSIPDNFIQTIIALKDVRNDFAHSIIHIPEADNYETITELVLVTANPIKKSDDLRIVRQYKLTEHENVIKGMKGILKQLFDLIQ